MKSYNAREEESKNTLRPELRAERSIMTLHNIASQLLSLSVDKKINGVKFSAKRLETVLGMWLRPEALPSGKNKVVAEIHLPDGFWFFYIVRLNDGEFDYYIPDTREQEKRVIALLHQ